MNKKLTALLISMLFFSTLAVHSSAAWEKLYTKKGITVSSRSVELSDFNEFMGTGIVNAPLEVVIAVLQDVEAMPGWLPDCKGAKLIRQNDKNSAVTQVIIDFPIPLTDRYIIVHTRGRIDSKKPIVHITSKNINEKGGKEVKGLVRMPLYRGTYQLEYLSRRKTRVTYRMHLHPGGTVVAWMAHMTMKKNPYRFLMKLREMSGRKKYMAKMHTPETLDSDFLAKILTSIFRKKISDENLIRILVKDREVQRICLSKKLTDSQIEQSLLEYASKHYKQAGGRWRRK